MHMKLKQAVAGVYDADDTDVDSLKITTTSTRITLPTSANMADDDDTRSNMEWGNKAPPKKSLFRLYPVAQ